MFGVAEMVFGRVAGGAPAIDDLINTTAYSVPVLSIGVAAVLLAAVTIGWIRIRHRVARVPRELLHEPTLIELSARKRARYLAKVKQVEDEARAGKYSSREVALAFAALLRALATERSGVNCEAATVGEMRRLFSNVWPNMVSALERFESPSFAPTTVAGTGRFDNRNIQKPVAEDIGATGVIVRNLIDEGTRV